MLYITGLDAADFVMTTLARILAEDYWQTNKRAFASTTDHMYCRSLTDECQKAEKLSWRKR